MDKLVTLMKEVLFILDKIVKWHQIQKINLLSMDLEYIFMKLMVMIIVDMKYN